MRTKYIIILFLLLSPLLVFSYIHIKKEIKLTADFERSWEKVDSLDARRLYKSASAEVDKIYSQAKKENNQPQVIKALIYKAKYINHIEEESYVKIIKLYEEEINQAAFPAKNILTSMLAEFYWQYYENNRWRILDRGEVTAGEKPEDISTWSGRAFVEKVVQLYNSSLQNSDSLKQMDVRSIEPILITQPHSQNYRPTLFDFLAHRALDFYKNEEASIRKPVYAYKMDDPALFFPPQAFVNQNFETKDTTNLKYQAVKIFQQLTDLHLQDTTDTAPLLLLTLERLKFAYENAVLPNKGALYQQALEELNKHIEKGPLQAEILYHLALYHFELGQHYDPLQSDNFKWEKSIALKNILEAEAKNPDSIVAQQLLALKNQILQKQLQVMVEEVNLPEEPFRSLISFTNVSHVYFKAIKLSDSAKYQLMQHQREDTLLSFFNSLKVHKQWDSPLPNDGDHQFHRVEVKMPELENGEYLIMASPDKHFKDSIVAYGVTTISKLGFTKRDLQNGRVAFYVFNRHEGNPLKGAKVEIFSRKYDYNSRTYSYKYQTALTTDKNGKAEFKPDNNSNDYRIIITHKDQKLDFSEYLYSYNYGRERNRKDVRTFYFTDRKIYRPGQIVYFKGIMLSKDQKNYEILTKEKTTVGFYDVNGQKISEQTFTTNEYGSFSGSFIAPSGLTGRMQIRNESNGTFISVEEYKRPKFEVKFEPVKEFYKLNDSVTVEGNALAYAGSVIDDALVQYRVVRRTVFPFWYGFSRFIPTEEMEITNGTTETDSAGNFKIKFKAIPDPTISPDKKPQFNYYITASVTDVAGETQPANTTVKVGYVALNIDLDVPSSVNKDSLLTIGIKTLNLNDQPDSADVAVEIYKLKGPDRVLRERLWPRPDKFIYSKEQYQKWFDHDVYDNENDYTSWEREKQVWSRNLNTGLISEVKIPEAKNWEIGVYEVAVTAIDKFGEKVTLSRFITFFDMEKDKLPVEEIFWSTDIKMTAEPGETAKFAIGTATDDLFLLYEIEHEQKIIHSEWLKLDEEIKEISIPIKEEFRGNIFVHLATVKFGRFITTTKTVNVPWTNKQLNLELITFRDKLQPGAEETWTVKISGDKKDAVAAEMMATMYDASLDALAKHDWYFSVFPTNHPTYRWNNSKAFSVSGFSHINQQYDYVEPVFRMFDQLNWFGFYFGQANYRWQLRTIDGIRAQGARAASEKAESVNDEVAVQEMQMAPPPPANAAAADATEEQEPQEEQLKDVPLRENLNETAFFFPQLETDVEGNISFTFKMPEALTRWNFLAFAHTKDLKSGFLDASTVTQKELMVQPNAPRFLRQGDNIFISSKISNLSKEQLQGKVQLELFNALTNQKLDLIATPVKDFTTAAGQSTAVNWEVTLPANLEAVQYKIVAKAGNFSDGETAVLPVLSNRILVTETLPLQVLGNQTKTFTLDKLLKNNSSTLEHHKLTLEFTGNPAWYAVQALPYLMEYPYECSEQVFNRFYANALAGFTVNSNPKIKTVFEQWKNTDALVSNLQKNEDLKSLLLEETPWLMQGKNETEQKKRIAMLFDMNKMASEQNASIRKLKQLQTSNGGWPWFKGMPDDRYITQYIVSGLGHLRKLDPAATDDPIVQQMITEAVRYMDARIVEDYKRHIEKGKNRNKIEPVANINIYYLYARSFFPEINMNKETTTAVNFYKEQAAEKWVDQNKYLQGMIALALNRMDKNSTVPEAILKSLKETAINSEELGIYWKSNNNGWYWYQAPIETQSLLIEAFETLTNDRQMVDGMKLWLLKQKQVQHWPTTKATSEAVYALLLSGSDWLSEQPEVKITLGEKTINTTEVSKEAGTGYFQKVYNEETITPSMGKVTVSKTGEGVSWGAVYWQYFEDLDKITPHQSPLQIKKELYVQRNSDTGPVMEPVKDASKLKIGDKLVVRLVVKTDRDMEYIHLKDMRAAGFEPLNVLSGYKWKNGLGFYESTKDASTNFFFNWLPKGTHVLDYFLVVSQKGNFSNGIATIQSMYAPEFAAHSEGIRVKVE